MDHPRVIIIQTTPYSKNNSSRSLDSYFHYWEQDKVRQIFSRNWKPQRGHCGELFQITDSELLKKWLHKPVEVGKIYRYEELDEQGNSQVINDGELSSEGYKLGRSHTPLIELLRGTLWRNKYWCTDSLVRWLDGYKPEMIFYNFTNNLFLQKIVLFIAERYNIPIVTAVGDDYYFNDRKSLSPAYHLFRKKYKGLTEKVFSYPGSAVYVCDAIRDKYNERFGLNGETIYFSSIVTRKPFTTINKANPQIMYFGNIRLGRNHALRKIADALGEINKDFKLQVYANETDESFYGELKNHPNVDYKGAIPYSKVLEKIAICDIYVVAESFREEDINFTRYSLSTKAADGLASGAVVLAYGPKESGLIDYLTKTEAAVVCTDEDGIEKTIHNILSDQEAQKILYDKSAVVAKRNHTLEGSLAAFEDVISRAMR